MPSYPLWQETTLTIVETQTRTQTQTQTHCSSSYSSLFHASKLVVWETCEEGRVVLTTVWVEEVWVEYTCFMQ